MPESGESSKIVKDLDHPTLEKTGGAKTFLELYLEEHPRAEELMVDAIRTDLPLDPNSPQVRDLINDFFAETSHEGKQASVKPTFVDQLRKKHGEDIDTVEKNIERAYKDKPELMRTMANIV